MGEVPRGAAARMRGVTRLVVGPLLRFVDESRATVWVEVDRRCQVDVLGHRAATFTVGGRHYAVVVVEGLRPGSVTPYDVRVDGEVLWPLAGDAASIRAAAPGKPLRLVFGSCRVVMPQGSPYDRDRRRDSRGRGIDALRVLGHEILTGRRDAPDVLLLVGDQIYADEVEEPLWSQLLTRRASWPGEWPPRQQVVDYTDYAELYRAAWTEPTVRRLLATVPTAMIIDDHEVYNAWNASADWLADIRREPWWPQRYAAAVAAYWVYQHLGNIAPETLDDDGLLARGRWAPDRLPGLAAAGPPA